MSQCTLEPTEITNESIMPYIIELKQYNLIQK